MEFSLNNISEELHRRDLQAAFQRGNHKSANEKCDYLTCALSKEIQKCWNLILPDNCMDSIPHLVFNHMGVATHLGITEYCTFEPKNRVTHDLSFPGKFSGESVNSRVKIDSLEPCMFSYVFLCIIHCIVSLRNKYPQTKIWIRKEDIKSAFRRLHLSATTAYRSVV